MAPFESDMTPMRIPVHPQPGIFETTVAVVDGEDGEQHLVGHEEIETLLDYKPVTVEDLNARARANMRKGGWQPAENMPDVLIKDGAPAKKKTGKKTTAKKAPAKRPAKKSGKS